MKARKVASHISRKEMMQAVRIMQFSVHLTRAVEEGIIDQHVELGSAMSYQLVTCLCAIYHSTLPADAEGREQFETDFIYWLTHKKRIAEMRKPGIKLYREPETLAEITATLVSLEYFVEKYFGIKLD